MKNTECFDFIDFHIETFSKKICMVINLYKEGQIQYQLGNLLYHFYEIVVQKLTQ